MAASSDSSASLSLDAWVGTVDYVLEVSAAEIAHQAANHTPGTTKDRGSGGLQVGSVGVLTGVSVAQGFGRVKPAPGLPDTRHGYTPCRVGGELRLPVDF